MGPGAPRIAESPTRDQLRPIFSQARVRMLWTQAVILIMRARREPFVYAFAAIVNRRIELCSELPQNALTFSYRVSAFRERHMVPSLKSTSPHPFQVRGTWRLEVSDVIARNAA